MRRKLVDKFAFIDRMIFNYLIGNADAHGKNSFVLCPRGKTKPPQGEVEPLTRGGATSHEGIRNVTAIRFIKGMTDFEMTWEVTDVLLDEGIYLVTLGKRLA